jgi:hypothetical protein
MPVGLELTTTGALQEDDLELIRATKRAVQRQSAATRPTYVGLSLIESATLTRLDDLH